MTRSTPPSIPTPASLQKSNRRLSRHNVGVAKVIGEMKRGASLQLMFLNGRPVWRLSSGVFITTEVADVVIKDRRVFGCGDGLFAGHPIHHSQNLEVLR